MGRLCPAALSGDSQHLENRHLQTGKGQEGERGPLFTWLSFRMSPHGTRAANRLNEAQVENG